MAASKWPTYPVAEADSIFALGVASIEFVKLKSSLVFIFGTALGIEYELATMIHARCGNEACLKLIDQVLPPLTMIGPPSREVLDIRYFTKGFEACAKNRNNLMHSEISVFGGMLGSLLIKTTNQGRAHLSLQPKEKLRQVADDMHAYQVYGVALANAINAKNGNVGGFPWPDRPAPPNILEYTDAVGEMK